MTDLKLTCQTPHQYYDNSLHRFSDPAHRLTAVTWLCGGRAGCGLAALGAKRVPVPPYGTPATSVLCSAAPAGAQHHLQPTLSLP